MQMLDLWQTKASHQRRCVGEPAVSWCCLIRDVSFAGVQMLAGFVVRGCTGTNSNGALYISSEIRVHNCTLERNSGYYGAMRIEGGSPVLSSVVVSNNSRYGAVYVMGGTASFVDCRFVGNEVSGSEGVGGALYVHSSGHVDLTNSTFESNTAADGSCGGAVAVWGGSLNSSGCRFVHNEVSGGGGFGGALYVARRGQVDLTDSTFESNTAADGSLGGAVAVWGGSLSSSGCRFAHNEVSGDDGFGGALVVQSPGQVDLTDSTFESNTAADGSCGGAVAFLGGSLTLSDTVFVQNTAHKGGAVWWKLDTWLLLCEFAASCSFANNYASAAGGAIFVSDVATQPPGCIWQAADTMVQNNNTAIGYGDGIASGPFSVQMISVQGQSYLPSEVISIYPGQPVSFVVSVHDVFGQTCVQSPPIDFNITTSPKVPLISAASFRLNATGIAPIIVGQTVRKPFTMTFVAENTPSSSSVQFHPDSKCPIGFVAPYCCCC